MANLSYNVGISILNQMASQIMNDQSLRCTQNLRMTYLIYWKWCTQNLKMMYSMYMKMTYSNHKMSSKTIRAYYANSTRVLQLTNIIILTCTLLWVDMVGIYPIIFDSYIAFGILKLLFTQIILPFILFLKIWFFG